MAKYDGLIIPRSYNDYINKSDPAGVAQALQLTGVMDNAPTAQSTKPAKSGGIFAANAVIMASNKTLSGVAISAGSVVRVLFTAALTGSDATTGLTLTYNGTAYAVKVGKNGALANFLANNIDGSYIYCQAYTTLELMFDGSQFIIMGNPVVISSSDYTIYTDGYIEFKTVSDISYQSPNPVSGGRLYSSAVLFQHVQINKGNSYNFTVRKKGYAQNLILIYSQQGGITSAMYISIWGANMYPSSYSTNQLTLSFSGSSSEGGTLTVGIPNTGASFAYISLLG